MGAIGQHLGLLCVFLEILTHSSQVCFDCSQICFDCSQLCFDCSQMCFNCSHLLTVSSQTLTCSSQIFLFAPRMGEISGRRPARHGRNRRPLRTNVKFWEIQTLSSQIYFGCSQKGVWLHTNVVWLRPNVFWLLPNVGFCPLARPKKKRWPCKWEDLTKIGSTSAFFNRLLPKKNE